VFPTLLGSSSPWTWFYPRQWGYNTPVLPSNCWGCLEGPVRSNGYMSWGPPWFFNRGLPHTNQDFSGLGITQAKKQTKKQNTCHLCSVYLSVSKNLVYICALKGLFCSLQKAEIRSTVITLYEY
jgi:hypothetical protein